MIKIFRNTRKKLLEENKISKYLKYAGGEIILVMIGILLALQINTWQENTKKSEIERAYLSGIQNNLDQDIYELNKLIGQDTTNLYNYSMLLSVFNDKSINKYSKEFINAIGQSYIARSFKGNSIVFEDMKSSGKINHIKSDVLRFSILEYYNASQREIVKQNEMQLPEMNKLREEAFHDNMDMNSLIEGFMFDEKWSVEVNPLDLSFFDSDVNSVVVKKFSNRISIMKALVLATINSNYDLELKAQKLKIKIAEYLSTDDLDGKVYISSEKRSAIKDGDIEKLKALIPMESMTTCFDTKRGTGNYLEIAIVEGSFESLKYFAENGADIEQVCDNKTPLMLAAKYNELDMVKYLVDAGSDINFASIKDKTALDYAIQYERSGIVAYLKSLNAKQVKTLN